MFLDALGKTRIKAELKLKKNSFLDFHSNTQNPNFTASLMKQLQRAQPNRIRTYERAAMKLTMLCTIYSIALRKHH